MCHSSKNALWLILAACAANMNLALGEPECGGKPADVVFLLDASTSIWGPNFHKQLSFVQDIIDEFHIRPTRTRCGLITFSDYARVEFNLDTFRSARDLRHAVERTSQLHGSTRTDLALERMREMFASEHRRGVPKLAIILTDGESDYVDLTTLAVDQVKADGITVLAVGIGSGVNADELRALASAEELAFTVDTYDALHTLRKVLAIKACSVEDDHEAVAPQPTPPTKGCDGKPADVVFALDASASIWDNDFKRQLTFIQDIVNIFEISEDSTRIGILTFGDGSEREFYMDRYTDSEELVDAIGKIRQSRGNTNTAAAIRALRTQFFTDEHARGSVVHIGIIITDGQSDDSFATATEAHLAREDGIHLFAIGVGHNVDQKELYNIASEPASQYVFEVTTYEALDSIKNLLAMKACEVTEPPTTTTTTTTTTSTTAPASYGCSAQFPADLIFALPADSTDAQSKHVLKFISKVTRKLDIDTDAIRLGLLPKHCYSVPGFHLREGNTDTETVLNMISSTQSNRTKAQSIIQHMCDVSFQAVQGARENAKKIGVVFVNTDESPEALMQAAQEAIVARNQYGVEIVIVGVGSGVTDSELETISQSQASGKIMMVPGFGDLRKMAGAMTRRLDNLCLDSTDFQLYRL